MTNKQLPHIVVIGAGFGGIETCKQLQHAPVRISLIDKHNYHLFQPLLYQVASAALSPAEIAYPIRTIFRDQSNVQVYLEEATNIDLENKKVVLTDEETTYDYLVVAAGATHSYFGNNDWEKWAPGLKSVDDATEIRKRILIAFEEAEYEADETTRKAKLTFVIVGGGPTGVELAGALMEIAAKTIPDDFRNVDTSTARVILVHSGARILPSFAESLSQSALDELIKMGVEVQLNSRVTKVDAEGVMVGEQRVRAHNVFWAAGVQASPLARTLNVPLDRSGKIIVNPTLSIPGYPEVFAIGDIAAMTDGKSGTTVPAVAQGAVQSGRFVGQLIQKLVTQGATQEKARFSYFDKGSMATIGKAKAVAEIGKLKFTGSIAWLLWSFVHVLFLVGFRNRIAVVLAWVWNYLFSSRGARLITGKVEYSVKHIPIQNND
jgi:NADH dehydrogenase